MCGGLRGTPMNPTRICGLAVLALLTAAPGLTAGATARKHGAHAKPVRKPASSHTTPLVRPAQVMATLDLSAPAVLPPALKIRTVQKMEAGLRLPRGAAPLSRYVRLYTLDRAGTLDDLPVTTVRDDLALPAGRRIVVGVLVLPDMFREARLGAPGPRIVPKSQMLQFYQGGCGVVNVVYDTEARRTLATWCNNADRVDLSP